MVQVNGAPVILAIAALGLVGDVVPHADVGGGTDVDVGIHVLHALELVGGDLLHVLRVGPLDQRALHGVVENVDKGLAPHGVGLLDQCLHQSRLTSVELNEDLLPGLQLHRTPDQEPGQLSNPRIFHAASSFLK